MHVEYTINKTPGRPDQETIHITVENRDEAETARRAVAQLRSTEGDSLRD